MGIFDTHAHYLKRDFGDDLEKLLGELPEQHVERVLAVGCGLGEVEEREAGVGREQ